MKKWMCGVCGFTVTAEEPPEKCPVCGADRSLFIAVEDSSGNSSVSDGNSADSMADKGKSYTEASRAETADPVSDSRDFKARAYRIAEKIIDEHHLHPISVHIPNGVVPVAFIFILLSMMSGSSDLDIAAFLNMIFVLLALPAVIFTGYSDWKKKYSGAMTTVFKTKMICAAVVLSGTFISVLWRAFDSTAGSSYFYLLLNAVILASAGTAGFMGGKLVFKK